MGLPAAGTISRRHFACGVIPALIGSLVTTLPWMTRAALPVDFGAMVHHRASAERIGRRYLAMLATDMDKLRFLTLSPMLDRAMQAIRHEPEIAGRLLRQGIEDDFRRADIAIIDGWVLAATEARLCAIIALA